MRYDMKDVLILLLLLLVVNIDINAQNTGIDEINRTVDELCGEGLYTNASNLLVEKANDFLLHKDTLIAYELQLKNCYLTDEHLDIFFNHGLSWEGYFANWYVTISIAAWLKKNKEIAPELLRILDLVSQKEPKLLPFYCSTLGFILYDYKTVQNDDSIFVLQKALDYIKQNKPTIELVNQYNKITDIFFINRFYNTFDSYTKYSNKIEDCDLWFLKNRDYIDSLDTSVFKDNVVSYYVRHMDNLYVLASTLSAQYGKYEEAINLYLKGIDYLNQVKNLNDTIPVKIAACYSNIASDYFLLGNVAMSKVYSDKAFSCLLTPSNSLDYCSVLSNLALNFFNLNQAKTAASLKKTEITIREKTPIPPTCSDYSAYMMFNQEDTLANIILGSKLEEQYGNSDTAMTDVYRYLADAYSKLMHNSLRKGDKDSAEFEKENFEKYIKKAKDNLSEHKDYLEKFNLIANSLGNIYSSMSSHFERLGNLQESFSYAERAVKTCSTKSYYNVALKSSATHNIHAIHYYLPKYFKSEEQNIETMMPLLGSTESEPYLIQGAHPIYRIPEWASWNPTDSVSVCIAYDAALLMKGLVLRYNVFSPYFESHPELKDAKLELDRMRDSIYTISDDNARLLALHQYELKERNILNEVNKEFTSIHWKDVSNALKDNEACIEFVKYTTNAYSWSDDPPQSHYAAIVLLPNGSMPIFVDLFNENEVLDVYNLQPKSYDNEIGQTLYSKIWGRMQHYIDGKRTVYFSPMGLLNLINIELLKDSTNRIAAERFNLYRLSSTKNILSQKNKIRIDKITSFGGIDYDSATEYTCVMDSINTRGNWAFLHNTLLEVKRIENLLKDKNVDLKTYIGSYATESTFKSLDGTRSNIIHIASHGYYIPKSKRLTIPYFANSDKTKIVQDELFYSGLILSGGQKAWINSTFEIDSNDGILSSYEISKLDLHNVELVVLSACETGIGDNLFDGIFGLQRAFKKAGVKTILMSLWQIDDKATSEYMSLFYERLFSGYSKHEAYISTILAMKEKYPDPYYWASFILLD